MNIFSRVQRTKYVTIVNISQYSLSVNCRNNVSRNAVYKNFRIYLSDEVFFGCRSTEEGETKDEVATSVFADIRPDEIPDVPSQKFLYRGDIEKEKEAYVK